MPPRALACCQAAQRKFRPLQDSVWISDGTLQHALDRFLAVSKTRKQYAHFVPGTLEARRRSGKRRMTLSSEFEPPKQFGATWLTQILGEVDATQWRWEPPTPRGQYGDIAVPEKRSWLPSWFLARDPPSSEVALEPDLSRELDQNAESHMAIVEDAAMFRETMTMAQQKDLFQICQNYSIGLKQKLQLGLVSSNSLNHALDFDTNTVRLAASTQEFADSLCLLLYSNLWDGMTSCSVVRPAEFERDVAAKFLAHLLGLPSQKEVKSLVSSLVVEFQMQGMEHELSPLAIWWLSGSADTGRDFYISKTTEDEMESKIFSRPIIRQIQHLMNVNRTDLSTLAKLLRPLSATLIHSISERVLNSLGPEKSRQTTICCWLSVLSQLPEVPVYILSDIWKTHLNTEERLDHRFMANLLLNFWRSHWSGFEYRSSLVKNDFELSGYHDLASLLHAVNVCDWDVFDEAVLSVFRFLEQIGRYDQYLKLIRSLDTLQTPIHMKMLFQAIALAAKHDKALALKLFDQGRRCAWGSMWNALAKVDPELKSKLLVVMVHDKFINPRDIMRATGMYYYYPPQVLERKGLQKPPTNFKVSTQMAELVTQMAVELAKSPRPPRVAFRYIHQCYRHLSWNNAPMTPELTRALTKTGIFSYMKDGLYVGCSRGEWVMHCVEQVEGPEVKQDVRRIVNEWNHFIDTKENERKLRRNPLQKGLLE